MLPRRDRPRIEKSYGVPDDEEGMLPFAHLEETLRDARSYWLSTVRPDGRPHAVPVWGVWVDDAIHFGGGRTTRKARNLAANRSVVLHTESAHVVVILEGVAVEITDTEQQRRIDAAYEAKYGMPHGTPLWRLQPSVAFAWTEYPTTVTRWTYHSHDDDPARR